MKTKLFNRILIILLIGILLTPSKLFVSAFKYEKKTDNDKLTETVLRYVENEDNLLQFNLPRAHNDRVNKEIIEIGLLFNKYSEAMNKQTTNRGLSTRTLSIPIWGNWCGYGYGSGDPIDLLDYACKLHDQCYEKNKYWDCDCDKALIDRIDGDLDDMTSGQRKAAIAIKAYFLAQRFVNGCR